MSKKMAITCNGVLPKNLYAAFVLGSAASAAGYEVLMYFTPDAATALKKGELEKINKKGMPDMMALVEGFQALDGRILLCELAFAVNDMTEEELRDGVEIVGATSFVLAISDAQLTFSF